MATLQYLGGDPLEPRAWRKSDTPLLQNREDGLGPYGPGHGCFLHAGGETVALFHATDRDSDGSQNRRCRMQRVRWTMRGPDMGGYVGAQTKDVEDFLQNGKDPGLQHSVHQHGGQCRKDELNSLVHTLKGAIVERKDHYEL